MHYIKTTIGCLLLLALLLSACMGQTTTPQNGNRGGVQQSFTSQQPTLTKTQGSNQYDNVHSMIQDKAGNLWIATTGEGVYRYDGKLFTQFTQKDGLGNNKVWCVLEDRSGNIWFGTGNGVSRYDGKHMTTVPMTTSNNFGLGIVTSVSTLENRVWSMLLDSKGNIWFGSDEGVYCYNGKGFSKFLDNLNIGNKTGLTLKSMQCILEDKKGNIWFGSGPEASEGICVYDGKSLTQFKPQGETWIRNIWEDKNGRLLFATRHVGILEYDGKNFTNFSAPQQLKKELINTTLTDSKGNIWYGSDYMDDHDVTKGGCWKFDGTNFIEYKKEDGLLNTSIYSFLEDRAGNIWIGTRDCGLYRYNGKMMERFSE